MSSLFSFKLWSMMGEVEAILVYFGMIWRWGCTQSTFSSEMDTSHPYAARAKQASSAIEETTWVSSDLFCLLKSWYCKCNREQDSLFE